MDRYNKLQEVGLWILFFIFGEGAIFTLLIGMIIYLIYG